MEPVVVVGLDQSLSSEIAVEEAAAEAERRSATLVVVHAYGYVPPVPPPFKVPVDEPRLRETAVRLVERAADRLRHRYPGLAVQGRVLLGHPPTLLAETAADADLLVVGHRGSGGFPDLGLGSVALSTVTRSSRPTLVVRGGRRNPRHMVLAAIDTTAPDVDSDEILGFAFAEAARREATLTAVSAWEVPSAPDFFDDPELRRVMDLERDSAEARLTESVSRWRATYPHVVAESGLIDGRPATVLLDASSRADLVVVGAHRWDNHGIRLGPTAHMLLRHAPCPVAVVPQRAVRLAKAQ